MGDSPQLILSGMGALTYDAKEIGCFPTFPKCWRAVVQRAADGEAPVRVVRADGGVAARDRRELVRVFGK